jgi:PIN domain nuclease of toxin-antitoxin system
MRIFVVDTHALAWFVSRDRRLGARARTVLRDPNVRLIIPAIVLAEIKYLAHKGRLMKSLDEVLRVIGSDPRFTIYPIDLSVISEAPLGLDFYDSLIVGTALVQREIIAGILTQDKAIASSSPVPTLW